VSREKSDSSSGGLQIQTLLISAVSAVAAATIVPLFWVRGTVIATAMTPVIVALVTEALRRPVQKVSAVAPKVTAARQRVAVPVRGRPRGPIRDDPHDFDPVPDDRVDEPVRGVAADDPFGLRAPQRRPWWRIGLVTGVLAFLLAAAVVTASELTVFGGSVSGNRGSTTLFGGGSSSTSSKKKTTTRKDAAKSSSTPSSTATATPTATPTPGATATPRATATPSATPAPSATPSTAAPTATPTP
jgi:hypothetical protein